MLDRLERITAPTHVICGEEDIFTPPRYSIDIANAIPGAKPQRHAGGWSRHVLGGD